MPSKYNDYNHVQHSRALTAGLKNTKLGVLMCVDVYDNFVRLTGKCFHPKTEFLSTLYVYRLLKYSLIIKK